MSRKPFVPRDLHSLPILASAEAFNTEVTESTESFHSVAPVTPVLKAFGGTYNRTINRDAGRWIR